MITRSCIRSTFWNVSIRSQSFDFLPFIFLVLHQSQRVECTHKISDISLPYVFDPHTLTAGLASLHLQPAISVAHSALGQNYELVKAPKQPPLELLLLRVFKWLLDQVLPRQPLKPGENKRSKQGNRSFLDRYSLETMTNTKSLSLGKEPRSTVFISCINRALLRSGHQLHVRDVTWLCSCRDRCLVHVSCELCCIGEHQCCARLLHLYPVQSLPCCHPWS